MFFFFFKKKSRLLFIYVIAWIRKSNMAMQVENSRFFD